MRRAVPDKEICLYLLGLQKIERENLQRFIKYWQATSSFLRCLGVFFPSFFIDATLDFWRISPPLTEENLVFFDLPVTVKGIVLRTTDRICSLHIHSQLLLSPLKSIFTRIFKFLAFKKYLFTLQMSADEGIQAKLQRLFLNIFLPRMKLFKLYSSNLFLKSCSNSVQVSGIDTSVDLKILSTGTFTAVFWLSVLFLSLPHLLCSPVHE